MIVYRIHRDQEGKVVKKVKTRRKDTEERRKTEFAGFFEERIEIMIFTGEGRLTERGERPL
ncbi:MAG: hypothetical protein ACLUAR_17780 [Pilosibacter sp.]